MADLKTLRERFEELARCTEPGQYATVSGEDVRAVVEALRDVTNPKRGSCSTCIHEYEPGSDYCLVHQRCKVCGVCSGYEE